jgi:hypothetical protein
MESLGHSSRRLDLPAVTETDTEDAGAAAERAFRTRFMTFDTLMTGVRHFECAFNMRTSSLVHGLIARRADFARGLTTSTPGRPVRLVSLKGAAGFGSKGHRFLVRRAAHRRFTSNLIRTSSAPRQAWYSMRHVVRHG